MTDVKRMTPEHALACIEQEILDVMAEGMTAEDCDNVPAYVVARAYRRLVAHGRVSPAPDELLKRAKAAASQGADLSPGDTLVAELLSRIEAQEHVVPRGIMVTDEMVSAVNDLDGWSGFSRADLQQLMDTMLAATETDRAGEPERTVRVIREILAMCDLEAHAIDHSLPDAHGGKFAKKFAANSIRGLAGKIQQKYGVSL